MPVLEGADRSESIALPDRSALYISGGFISLLSGCIVQDVVFQGIGVAFVYQKAVTQGFSGLVDAVGIAAYQGVPGGQVLSFIDKAVATAFGQPAKISNLIRAEDGAVRHPAGAGFIVAALHGFVIQKPAGDIGIEDFSGIGAFQFVQTAFSTAVTQGFPLCTCHIC